MFLFRALEEFNNAVVLTNRTLMPNELFEVRVERQVEKWAGSLEIGVTAHCPETMEFPATMTNLSSNTWMMSGGSIVQDGVTVIEEYDQNVDDVKVVRPVGFYLGLLLSPFTL